jgi:hypothetical protein
VLRASDHGYLWPAWAVAIGAAYGLEVEPQRRRNDPAAFKGLDVPDTAPGALVEGYDATDLAELVAGHLSGGAFRQIMNGRGSRLRYACDVIERA